jgi:hypothetical protein
MSVDPNDLYNTEGLETLSVDELVQKLEAMEKNNE